MIYKYKNININYTFYKNNSDKSLVFLHGWGQNIQMMMPIAKPFIKKYDTLIIDLPGFGQSEEPKEVWSIYDYSEMVNSLVKELGLKNEMLVGHSFGGKISLAYAIKYKPSKIVLLASPYRVKIKKDDFKTKSFKALKKIPVLNKLEKIAKKYVGSEDYRNASDMMRKVLVQHVNLDLSKDAKNVECPTLLIWGTLDTAVPYKDALDLEKIIKDAGLVTYEGCTHYAYLERVGQTVNVLKSFIGDEKK